MIVEINNELVKDIISNYFNVSNPFNVYSKTIVYKENDEINGILVYDEIYDRIEIDYILVNENERKKGIGKVLINYLNNFDNISLEVRESNVGAIEFYKKCGFEIVSKRENYYKNEDGYLMCKKVK